MVVLVVGERSCNSADFKRLATKAHRCRRDPYCPQLPSVTGCTFAACVACARAQLRCGSRKAALGLERLLWVSAIWQHACHEICMEFWKPAHIAHFRQGIAALVQGPFDAFDACLPRTGAIWGRSWVMKSLQRPV